MGVPRQPVFECAREMAARKAADAREFVEPDPSVDIGEQHFLAALLPWRKTSADVQKNHRALAVMGCDMGEQSEGGMIDEDLARDARLGEGGQ